MAINDRFFLITIMIIVLIGLFSSNYLNEIILDSKKKKEILFGQTIDLDNNHVSKQYLNGFELAFQSVNRIGGINGYTLKIILYDDKYEKKLAVENAKLLIDYFDVLGVIGTWGTVNTLGILENAIANRPIPLIGPYTGSTLLVKNFDKHLILTQGQSTLEFILILRNMLANNINKIGIIYQDDDYGISYLDSFVNYITVNKLNIEIISIANYNHGSAFLYDTYKNLFNVNNPYNYEEYLNNSTFENMQAILLFTTDIQIANIYGFLKKVKPSIFIYSTTATGNSINNFKYIKNNTTNVYQTILGVDIKNYPNLYNKLHEEINYYNNNLSVDNKIEKIEELNSLYQGFYTGLLIVEVLKNIPDLSKITRKDFIDTFYRIQNFDIYGLKIGPFINDVNNIGVKNAYIFNVVDGKEQIIDFIS